MVGVSLDASCSCILRLLSRHCWPVELKYAKPSLRFMMMDNSKTVKAWEQEVAKNCIGDDLASISEESHLANRSSQFISSSWSRRVHQVPHLLKNLCRFSPALRASPTWLVKNISLKRYSTFSKFLFSVRTLSNRARIEVGLRGSRLLGLKIENLLSKESQSGGGFATKKPIAYPQQPIV